MWCEATYPRFILLGQGSVSPWEVSFVGQAELKPASNQQPAVQQTNDVLSMWGEAAQFRIIFTSSALVNGQYKSSMGGNWHVREPKRSHHAGQCGFLLLSLVSPTALHHSRNLALPQFVQVLHLCACITYSAGGQAMRCRLEAPMPLQPRCP